MIMRTKTSHTIVAFLVMTLGSRLTQAETVKELLNLYDKNGDGVLDKKEFDAALKANGIRVVTPAGAKRAARAQDLFNVAARNYPDTELRYKKRAAQAELLLHERPVPFAERSFASEGSAFSQLADLTTYERFLVRRAFSDLQLTGVEAERQPAETPKPDPIISFLENNFRIRDDSAGISGDAVADEPAKFAWTHSRGEKSFYSIDAAVLFTPAWLDWQWDKVETGKNDELKDWVGGARIRPAFEAHVSTQEGASRNQLTYSVPIQGRYKWFPGGPDNVRTEALPPEQLPFFSAHYFELAPLYMTDRVASVRTWGVDMKYEPSVPFLNLNHDVPRSLFHLRWLEGSMKGSLGFAVRKYEQGNPIATADADYGEFVASYQGEVVLFHRLTLRAKYSAASDCWGDMKSHDLFEGSAELLLDERNHFTVGVSYINGEEEPTFKDVDSITGWVGVKF
jgi:EF-hand domain